MSAEVAAAKLRDLDGKVTAARGAAGRRVPGCVTTTRSARPGRPRRAGRAAGSPNCPGPWTTRHSGSGARGHRQAERHRAQDRTARGSGGRSGPAGYSPTGSATCASASTPLVRRRQRARQHPGRGPGPTPRWCEPGWPGFCCAGTRCTARWRRCRAVSGSGWRWPRLLGRTAAPAHHPRRTDQQSWIASVGRLVCPARLPGAVVVVSHDDDFLHRLG